MIGDMAANQEDSETRPSDRDVLRAVVDVLVLGEPFVFSLWQASGLTLTQIRVLRAIQLTRPCAGDLAHDVGVPPSSLSRILERLEQRGLAMREIDRSDRRRVLITVTDAGASFLGTLPALDKSPLGQAVAELKGPEREAFIRGAAALVAAGRRRMPQRAPNTESDGTSDPSETKEAAHEFRDA
jgi:DNA-binding MarR family transcriptional regulator